MPSVILSDNGVSSGSAGLKSTAASDGVLVLQTTTSGGTATNAVYIDTSQNIGFGTSAPGYTASNRIVAAINGSTSSILALMNGGTNRGYLYADSTDTILWSEGTRNLNLGTASAGPVIFTTNNTERGRFNASAPILCLAGGNTSATGTGIAFPATQSASTDANTLDDYEEGTWTPTPIPVSGSFTTTSVAGWYVKIGRQVTLNGFIRIDDRGTAPGFTGFSNIPFTSSASTNAGASCAAREQSNTGVAWTLQLSPNSTNCFMREYTNSASISNGASWVFTITYEV